MDAGWPTCKAFYSRPCTRAERGGSILPPWMTATDTPLPRHEFVESSFFKKNNKNNKLGIIATYVWQ